MSQETQAPVQNVMPAAVIMQKSPEQIEGEKAAQLSLLFGIVGFFVLGIILGPLAIWQAKKAEDNHAQAAAGKILGWITTIWGALWLIGLTVMIIGGIGLFGAAASSTTYGY